MLVSFQVQGPTLASMLREQFVRQNLCVGMISDMIVDHLEVSKNFFNPLARGPNISIGLPTLFEVNGQVIYTTTSIAAQAVLLRLWISVNLTDLDRLKQAGGKAPQTDLFSLPLFVRLGCFVSNNGTPFLSVTFERIDLPEDTKLIGNFTVKQANGFLASVLPVPPPAPIDIVQLLQGQGIGGADLEIAWAGISSSEDNSVAEIRLEMQPKGTGASLDLAGWKSFYAGSGVVSFLSHASIDHGWGLHVDKGLLIATIENQLRDAVNDPGNKGKLRLNKGPSGTWQPNIPGVVTKLNVTAIQAVPCFFVMIDMALDIEADTNFSLDIPNQQFIVDNTLNIHKEEGPLVCAAISIGLLAAIATAVAFPAGLFLAPIAFAGGVVAVVVFAENQKQPLPQKPSCKTDPNNDFHMTCNYNLGLNIPSGKCIPGTGVRKIEGVWGDMQGLILAGSFTPPGLNPPTIEIAVTPFEWQPTGWSCSSSGGLNAVGVVDITRASGDYDFWFCNAEPVGQTASEYQPYLHISYQYCPIAVQVLLAFSPSTASSLSGPCQLLITTTGGSRLVVIDRPTPLTQEIIDNIKKTYDKWRIQTCFTLVDGWFRRTQHFNPKWSVDPDPGEKVVSQLWRIGAGGLPPGERLKVLGKIQAGLRSAVPGGPVEAGEEALVTGIASSAGYLMVDVVSNTEQLTLVREGDTLIEEQAYSIDIKQELYIEESIFDCGEPILAMTTGYFGGSTCVLLAMPTGFKLLSITAPGEMRLVNAISSLELTGVAAWGETLYAFDAQDHIWVANPAEPDLVQKAIHWDSADFKRLPRPIQTALVSGFRTGVRIGDMLAAQTADGMLRLIGEDGGGLPLELPEGRPVRIDALPGITDALAVAIESGETIVMQVRPGGLLEVQSRQSARLWMAGTSSIGSWLLRIDEADPNSVHLCRLAGIWQMEGDEPSSAGYPLSKTDSRDGGGINE